MVDLSARTVAIASAIAVLAATLPGASWAAPPSESVSTTRATAAILPLAVEGAVVDSDRSLLLEELIGGLRRGSFDVIGPDELESVRGAASCTEDDCYRRIAKETKATHVVRAAVTLRDRDYRVDVALIDGKTGRALASTTESCEICGISDAGTLMSTAAATLRTKLDSLAQGPSILDVKSNPPDADVVIDGELVGRTPLQRPLVPGKRVLRISKDGYITVEREVTIVEGVSDTLQVELDKVPSRLPSRPWGWVSLGLGVAGIGTAVAFAVLDDRPFEFRGACAGGNRDADGDCRRLWDTDYIVLGTALAGAALTTLGIAILVDSAKRNRQSKRTGSSTKQARVGLGFGSLIVTGRF